MYALKVVLVARLVTCGDEIVDSYLLPGWSHVAMKLSMKACRRADQLSNWFSGRLRSH
jgi:hypothetical protein